MADVTFFDGFTMTWSQDGVQAPISQDAYKAGWAFIGDVPPAREQFNAVHWLDSKRQQWLFGQVKGVTDAAGMTLSAGSTGTLWAAISSKLNQKADIGTRIVAGNGLVGGGTLDEDREIAMGQPSTISSSTSNSASGTTHTHELSATGVEAGIYGSKSQIPSITFDAKGRATAAGTNKVSVGDVQDVLALANGGTGAGTASQARANLGLASFLYLAAHSLTSSGYVVLRTNDDSISIVLQWGITGVPGDSAVTFNFPMPFPNECLGAIATLGNAFNPTADAGCAIYNLTPTTATIMVGTAPETGVRWFAVGH